MADGLFQHDARLVVGQAGDAQVVGDGHEQLGRGGQVVDACQPAGLAQVARQAAEVGTLRGVHGEVVQARREALPDLLVEVLAGDLCAAVAFGELDVVVARQRAAGQ